MRVLLILVALVAAWYVLFWFIRQPGKVRWQALAASLGVLLIVLAASGRLTWVFAVFGALLPFLHRLLSLVAYLPVMQRLYKRFQGGPASTGQASGQQSTVESRFFRMTFDHDTGAMDGQVLEGRFSGKALSGLSLDELLELLFECERDDPESAQLLRAYLDRVHGEAWEAREDAGAGHTTAGFAGDMTRREAYEILGLEEGASDAGIKEAHRRLMQKLHPDRGGSTYLAAKINQAKELLLGKG
ncbi:MAG: DnaJ domain-containing protein [Gammaproteobacteria bacterium]